MHVSGWCKQFGRFSLYTRTILSHLSEVHEKHLEIFQSGQTESDSRTFMELGGSFIKETRSSLHNTLWTLTHSGQGKNE